MKRIALSLAAAAVLALPAATLACHREPTVTAKVDCAKGIRLEGRGFAKSDFPLALDGPGEMELVLTTRPARNWHTRIAIEGDGTYTLIWGSGFYQWSVDCEAG